MAYTADQLQQVEDAIIALAAGKRRVEVRFADRTVKYSEADLSKLQALRDTMRKEITDAAAAADASATRRPRMFRARTTRGL